MEMISKRFILSMGLLATVGAGSAISNANAQPYPHNNYMQDHRPMPPQGPLQRMQQSENAMHNRINEHGQAIQQRMDEQRDRIDRAKDFPKEQRKAMKRQEKQQRRDWNNMRNNGKRDMHDMTHPFSDPHNRH